MLQNVAVDAGAEGGDDVAVGVEGGDSDDFGVWVGIENTAGCLDAVHDGHL